MCLVVFFVLDAPRLGDGSATVQQATVSNNSLVEQPPEVESAEERQQVASSTQTESTDSELQELSTSWMAGSSLPTGWYVQIGSFKSSVEAEVERLKYGRIEVPVRTDVSEDKLTHLFVGPHSTEAEATQTTDRIKRELGVSKFAIRWIEGQAESEQTPAVQPSSESSESTSVEVADSDPAPTQPDVAVVKETAESSPQLPELPTAPETETVATDQPTTVTSSAEGGWYIQVGAFKDAGNARKLGDEVRNKSLPLKIERSDSRLIRVLVGPYATRDNAVKAQSEVLRVLALGEAVIRRIEG